VPEFGSVDDPAEFRALRSYSPYHNVTAGTCYPPTLVTAGERDETAVPWHAYKFIARLQHAQGCDHPVLLQVIEGAGHTFGTDDRQSAKTWARQLTFLERTLRPRKPDR
jgi:prolyl oligopeptidase